MPLDYQSIAGAHNFMAARPEVIAAVEDIERQLKEGDVQDPTDGWGHHIVVRVEIPAWAMSYLEREYERNGWKFAHQRDNEYFFLIPDFHSFPKA